VILQAEAAPSSDWVLSYENKSTNAFIWDKNAAPLIKAAVPSKLSREVLNALGGPPEPVFVAEKRYVSVAACVPHYCPEKGFFWIDTRTGQGLGAHFIDGKLSLGSNTIPTGQLPAFAVQALKDWMKANGVVPTSAEFIARNGSSTTIDAAAFKPTPQFTLRAGGPSYDCAAAATATEKVICTNASLSRQDLALAQLVTQIREGHDTVPARNQLRDLQRRWLKERDTRCTTAPDINACLETQYQTQYDRLMHWIPAR
jgi:hypothetical protein